jgi:hypothetical protein
LTASTAFTLTVNAVNDAPTITSISNQTIQEDSSTGALAFTVSDIETEAGSLTLSGASSNTTLVPNSNILFDGTGGSRTVTVTPAANQNGTTTITLTVSDGALTANTAFTLTVNPVNDAPALADVPHQATRQDTPTLPISLTLDDTDSDLDALTLTATSDNMTLVPNSNIVFGGTGSSRTVTLTPAPNQFGTTTITLTLSDGALTASDTFVLTVFGWTLPPTPLTVIAGMGTLPPNLTVGTPRGGTPPYTLQEDAPTLDWLDLATTGDLTLTPGQAVPLTSGSYTLRVRVTDALGASVAIPLALTVEPLTLLDVTPATVFQSDLDAGAVTLTFTFNGEAADVAQVQLTQGAHVVAVTPTPTGTHTATASLASASVGGVYGRYRLSLTPVEGDASSSSSVAVQVVEFLWQGWEGSLELAGDPTGVKRVRLGSALNGSDAFDATEDLLLPPPIPDVASLGTARGNATLSRDIVGMSASAALTWEVRAVVPSGVTATLTWEALRPLLSHYDYSTVTFAGQTHNLARVSSLTLPVGTNALTVALTRSAPRPVSATLGAGWGLFSLPGPGVETTPVGLASKGVDTVYGWDAAHQGYVPVTGSAPLVPITSGYFVHRDPLGGSLTTTLEVNLDTPSARSTTVTLHPGWNLVGVIDGGLHPSDLSEGNTVFEWTGVAYELATTLRPFGGYWVFNGGPTRSVSVTQGRYRASGAPTRLARPSADWLTELTLVLSDGSRRRVELGASAQSEAGLDGLDVPLPPSPPGKSSGEFYAVGSGRGHRLMRSVQAVGRGGAEWTLRAALGESGRLEWSGLRLPSGYRLTLETPDGAYDLSLSGGLSLCGGGHTWRVRSAWVGPSATRLLSNYPNPFNPETWIPFELTASSEVQIAIYDLDGHRVRALELGYREAGYYMSRSEAAYWDGRNELGERVSSGVYFYELRAGAYRETRRLLVLK